MEKQSPLQTTGTTIHPFAAAGGLGLILTAIAPFITRAGPPTLLGGSVNQWTAWFVSKPTGILIIGLFTTLGWFLTLLFIVGALYPYLRALPYKGTLPARSAALAGVLLALLFSAVNIFQVIVAKIAINSTPSVPAVQTYLAFRNLFYAVPLVSAVMLGAAGLSLLHQPTRGRWVAVLTLVGAGLEIVLFVVTLVTAGSTVPFAFAIGQLWLLSASIVFTFRPSLRHF